MGCLLVLLAAIAPRLVLLFVWLFTSLVTRAFDSFIVPLLGIIFLPLTTLVYVLFFDPGVGVTGFGWLWVALALIVDIGTYGGGSAYGGRDEYR